jgi:hypothetical protein
VGTRLSWHNDAQIYRGSFAYYAHPEWNALWGGELMVANELVQERSSAVLAKSEHPSEDVQFDNPEENKNLMEEGYGRFVAAKSNRLVLIGSGVSHMVSHVHAAAGDHVWRGSSCEGSGAAKTPLIFSSVHRSSRLFASAELERRPVQAAKR